MGLRATVSGGVLVEAYHDSHYSQHWQNEQASSAATTNALQKIAFILYNCFQIIAELCYIGCFLRREPKIGTGKQVS